MSSGYGGYGGYGGYQPYGGYQGFGETGFTRYQPDGMLASPTPATGVMSSPGFIQTPSVIRGGAVTAPAPAAPAGVPSNGYVDPSFGAITTPFAPSAGDAPAQTRAWDLQGNPMPFSGRRRFF